MAIVSVVWSVAAQTAAPADQKPAATAPAAQDAHVPERKLTEKQKALADQADKLLIMATELKQQVDRTNRNILSVKVVEKADEIEQYARRMKDQARK